MGRTKPQSNKKYSEQQLFSAIQAVKNGLSQFAAAKKFSVPRSTLFNKITGKTLIGKKPGPTTVLLPEEERTIEKWVFGLAVRGFPVTKRQLKRSIQLYLNINKRKTVFKNNLPGRKWYNSFRQRHPKISEKISQNLTLRRAAVSADKIREWHAEVMKYCEEHDLMDALNDPSRVFNMDEKGFILTPGKEVVLVQRGDKAVYNRSKNDEKECVTALLGGSASGKMTPPMMVHSYKRMPAAILASNPAKWSVGISDNGWQTQQTFHDYMVNIFYKWLLEERIQLPVIVFIDGHKSHVSLTLSDFCAEHQIELIALYPNSTHLTQPMDVGVFKPLNVSWTNQAKDWRLQNQYAKIEKKDVAPILEKAINGIKYGEHLKNAFRKSGIYPFNIENIDLSRVLPTLTESASQQEQLWNPQNEHTSEIVNSLPDENAAVASLQHFEQVMGSSLLNSFRLSGDVWTGAKEYSVLFTIWKQMYAAAAKSISSENSGAMIVDVVKIDESIVEFTQDNDICFIVDDSTWSTEEMDSIVELDTALVQNNIVNVASPASKCQTMIPVTIEDPSPEIALNGEGCPEIQDGESSVTDETTDCIQKSCDAEEPHENFNSDAFKEAFFWPAQVPKKAKKESGPRISSVMTSDDWREHERFKMQEKQQQQAAKDARKVAREKKKLETAKMAAEKNKLKEQKAALAKKAAEAKKLTKIARSKTQNRGRRAKIEN
ncbi:uncharacterized protein LOC119076333 [Bradysia coprophila]|uniref:uncharacterized protein LOC119076333 n=1 Tax=Bradysia coprophila TaxID=38358 RepID=UPI00187DAE3B|nr:uncharacterized protein LOC119076333 [Bradysia coprophila]